MALGVLIMAVFSMGMGHYPLPSAAILDVLGAALTGRDSVQGAAVDNVVLAVRLPRVLAAMLVGASLSSAGAAFQTLFRNPLASPALLGVSAGAGFGAALAMLRSAGGLMVQGAAFAGGILAVGTAVFIAGRLGRGSVLVLVLSGLVISALFQALTSALKYIADPLDTLPAIVFWLLGGLGQVSLSDLTYASPFALAGIAVLFLLRWPTQVLEAGDDEAKALGIEVEPLRLVLIAAATLTTAAAISIAGTVGWVGLLVPHLSRLLVGPAYMRLLPASALLGAGYLLLVDDFCRSAFATELPLGIATAVLGAPMFVAVLMRARRQWS
ncbi:ABC-type Fe3+-siderophore transport system, permease component [Methylomicrobium album BG8]|uniref:ABC-type Fe3+-siderophore transport system, permease component n=2 Tax=Methylococcaceae TaxID=403 RepID=H8GIK2_METAL|nr:ABC-type Fe3+-siderophore transport system, permease component [Methylomicrobium album BG8]